MAGLFGTLNQSVQSLHAQSIGIEVAGRNLANVNNPDFSRQRVVFGDRGTVITPQGAQSLGIEAKAIQQIRDSLIDQQVSRETASLASLTAEGDIYAKTQAALGESIDRTQTTTSPAAGMSGVVSDFFNAFQAFAASPTDMGQRQNLIQQAGILTDRFNSTDARLAQVQADAGTNIAADVATVNDLLANVASLNSQIGGLEINAVGTAVDLRDQRQAAIEKLAGLIGAETAPNATQVGQVDVFVRDGSGNAITLVSLASVNSQVNYIGTGLTAGTSGTPIALASGKINGLFTARDGAVQDLRDNLNTFAGQIGLAVNTAYNPLSTVGANFFTFTTGSAASTLTVAAGLTPVTLKASNGAAGDNTLAAAVAALASRSFAVTSGDAIDGTFSQYFSGVVSDFGRTVAGTENRLEDQSNITKLVNQQRQSLSGVSMDEEMADLLKYQRAFEASSKVISIIDGLLDIVVNRLGR
jgi:flagellar hook-associated protein 1 FlgK